MAVGGGDVLWLTYQSLGVRVAERDACDRASDARMEEQSVSILKVEFLRGESNGSKFLRACRQPDCPPLPPKDGNRAHDALL